jgi:choline dehydrogenase-like flavoprotein
MAQDSTSSAYDLIVVGSGATGGWAAKRAAEAGLRVALVEAGRKSADTDYREHVAASALPYRGRTKRPLEVIC